MILAVAGMVVNKVAFKGEQTAFIMELPLYHVPNAAHGGPVRLEQHDVIPQEGRHVHPAFRRPWSGRFRHLPGGNIETSILATVGQGARADRQR